MVKFVANVKRLWELNSYKVLFFFSLEEDQCPKWKLFKKDQGSEGHTLELHIHLSFLNNVLKIVHDAVL